MQFWLGWTVAVISSAVLHFWLFPSIPESDYHCTRYEIIGESPDRHEVCAVYERKEGV